MSDIDNIDHGLHGGAHSAKSEAAAKAYLEHQKMLARMGAEQKQPKPNNTPASEPEPDPVPANPVPPVHQEVAPTPTPVPAPKSAVAEDTNSDQVIKIPNKHMMFEIAYPDFETGLAVTMKARDINLDEDSLSILMDDSVTLKMPKWQPLYVKIYDIMAGEILRKVVWGGGTHSFGKVKHLSFIIVTGDGKTS